MSDLQIALLLIGVFIVAAVLIFNWKQERRYKKQAAAAFQSAASDVLLERSVVPRAATAERIEPGLREPVIGDIEASVNNDPREPAMRVQPTPVHEPERRPPLPRPHVSEPSVIRAA